MSTAPKPVAATIVPWLRDNGMPLGGVTSSDIRGLRAAVQVIDLMSYAGQKPELLCAFAACVRQMQESQWFLALHAIAHVLDWGDRTRIWRDARLPDLGPVPVCKFSPEARL